MKTILTILISVIFSVSISYFIPKESDFIELKDIGQIALDENDKIKIQAFTGNNLEMLGNNVIINAGNEFIELRVGDTSKIRIERENIYIDADNLFINDKKILID